MNLGIDISQIVYEGTGVSRFTKGLTQTILDLDRQNTWTFFFSSLRRNLDQELEKQIVNKGHKLVQWKIPPTVLSLLWNDLHQFSWLTPKPYTLDPGLDWFITSDWTEPALPVKKATIVHDLVYLRYPETVATNILTTQKKRLKLVSKESSVIFSDSNSTKKDLVELLGMDTNKVQVNYPGVSVQKATNAQINLTLNKFNLKRPFILSVGKLEPRKNVAKLIQAFNKVNNRSLDLVIVGTAGWGDQKHSNSEAMKQSNIKFTGLISDAELYSLYAACLFFIYPSLWEGFGYPLVEAMLLGRPTASSNNSSLKEIGKEATLSFDPSNVSDITKAMNRLINEDSLRRSLVKKGYDRSKVFTWENYLKKMLSFLANY